MTQGVQAPSLDELVAGHLSEFAQRFGDEAGVRTFFAPGRVNLMGAHLDYNGGPVMPMAIDRGTVVSLRPRSDRRVQLATTSSEDVCRFDLDHPEEARRGAWSDYSLGVFVELARGSLDRPGFDVLYGGNLPVGAGLSSSASICVATALALDRGWSLGMASMSLVETALWAEREFVGVQCGIMDPYAVGLARPDHILWLDCKDASWSHLSTEHVPFTVAVADTLVRRELAHGEFNRRVAECQSAFTKLKVAAPEATCLRDVPLEAIDDDVDLTTTERMRARHVLEEVARTLEARQALLNGDLDQFGAAMFAAHESLRDQFEVSVPELDKLVDTARRCDGVHGSRLTGAGFGGCTVSILERGAEEDYADQLARKFQDAFGRAPRIEFFRGDSGPRELT